MSETKTDIMEKHLEEHLKSVTIQNFLKFKDVAFIPFASSSGKNGSHELGIDGFGRWVVKEGGVCKIYYSPESAIKAYHTAVSK